MAGDNGTKKTREAINNLIRPEGRANRTDMSEDSEVLEESFES
jgi:hypothetical protein